MNVTEVVIDLKDSAVDIGSATVEVTTVVMPIKVETGLPGLRGEPGPPGVRGIPGPGSATFQWQGALQVAVGVGEWPLLFDGVCDLVGVCVVTPATGSEIEVDVMVNGVSIFSNSSLRPRILPNETYGEAVPDQGAFTKGDRLTFAITEIGSILPGAFLTGVALMSQS